MSKFEKFEAVFDTLDDKKLSEVTGGKRHWTYYVDRFGRVFNEISINVGL